jgi:hypothetical protein
MLKNRVKKSLMEIKENKEKQLIGESLIKNRLTIILEGINSDDEFKSLSKEKQLKISLKFIQELSYLESNGLLMEQQLGSLMQTIFGGWFGNITQTIFEPLFKKIFVPFFGEGFFTNFLTAYFTSRPSEVIKSFNDCKLMARLVAEGIMEAIMMQIQNDNGFSAPGYVFLRQTMGDVIRSNEFISGIEKSISNKVCELLGKFTGNAQKVVQKLKDTGTEVANTATNVVDKAKAAIS